MKRRAIHRQRSALHVPIASTAGLAVSFDPAPPGPALDVIPDFELQEPGVRPDEPAIAFDESDYAFKIAGVYQDALTRDWAMQMCGPVRQKFGEEYVRDTWHDVNSLSQTENLLEAVRAALAADVIVIAVHAADELPPEICAWIDVWLPRRPARTGTLAALIGVAGQPDAQALRTQEYLQAVANRGQLDFAPHERRFPGEPCVTGDESVR